MWAVIKDGNHTQGWCTCFRELIGKGVRLNEAYTPIEFRIDRDWANENSDKPYDLCSVTWQTGEFDMLASHYLNELLCEKGLTTP